MKKKRDHGFLEEWLGDAHRKAELNKLSKNAIRHDKYDKADIERMLKEIPELGVADDKITGVSDTGHHALEDLNFLLSKAEPKPLRGDEVLPSYLINRAVADQARKLKEIEELREHCVGDPIGAALGTIAMEPDLEIIFDRLKAEQEMAKKLREQEDQLGAAEEKKKTLDELMEEWEKNNPNEEPPKDFQKEAELLNKQIEALRENIGKGAEELQEELDSKKHQIGQDLKQGAQKALDEAQTQEAASQLWGQEPGAVHKMPIAERIALAKRIQDNPKFKRIAELIGPMSRLAFAEQARKSEYGRDEVHDIAVGNDLARVLPIELVSIRHPVRKLDFWKKFLEGSLLQYELRGVEKVARGGIIFCEDGSGSMGGEREVWAKAIGLCLLHIARMQKRSFYGIHFGSPGQYKCFDFTDPKAIDPEQVMGFAEYFAGGGTDFVTPLSVALDKLRNEFDQYGHTKGDICFVTDGQCGVPEEWLKEFKAEQERLGFRVFGINVGGGWKDEPMFSICSGRVSTVREILSGADVRDVFRGI